MVDYKSMYLKLFNAITDAVRILQTSQTEAEEVYLSEEPTQITVLPISDEQNQS
jgi:hypothetical protein